MTIDNTHEHKALLAAMNSVDDTWRPLTLGLVVSAIVVPLSAIIGRKTGAHHGSLASLMLLAASRGSNLEIRCEGADETEALQEICDLINRRFDEDE